MEPGQSATFSRTGQDTVTVNPTVEIAKNVIEGKPPSNEILNRAIDSTKLALEEELTFRPTTAPEVKLAKDAEAFLDVSKKLINEKNSNEQVQKFLLESAEASKELGDLLRIKAIEHQQELQDVSKKANESLEAMKSVAFQIVDSYEFRNVLSDLVEIVQHMVEEKKDQISSSASIPDQLQQGIQAGQQLSSQIQQGNIPVDEAKKQELLNSFKDILQRIHASPEFQRALQGIFSIVEQLKWVAEDEKQAVEKEAKRNPHIRALFQEGKEILSSFGGQDNIESSFNHLWELYLLLKDDYVVNKYWSEWKAFTLQVVENPELLENDKLIKLEAERLYDEGLRWMNEPKYTSRLRAITNDLQSIWDNIKEDELRKEFAEKTKILAEDLILDESGKPNLGVTLNGMNRFRTLLTPILRKTLEAVPIPAFSGSNSTYDWEVEGLILYGQDIIPDHIQVKVWGDADVSLTDNSTAAISYISIWLRNLAVSAKDLRFHFLRKSFPWIENRGIADVFISGDNWIKVTWRIEDISDVWTFNVQSVQCHVDKMKIKIKDATHNWLNKIISATLVGNLKRMVEKKVVESLSEGLGTVGEQLEGALRSKE